MRGEGARRALLGSQRWLLCPQGWREVDNRIKLSSNDRFSFNALQRAQSRLWWRLKFPHLKDHALVLILQRFD